MDAMPAFSALSPPPPPPQALMTVQISKRLNTGLGNLGCGGSFMMLELRWLLPRAFWRNKAWLIGSVLLSSQRSKRHLRHRAGLLKPNFFSNLAKVAA